MCIRLDETTCNEADIGLRQHSSPELFNRPEQACLPQGKFGLDHQLAARLIFGISFLDH